MKNLIYTIILICFGTQSIVSQSTDRFIRIVGNAKHTFMADGIRAEINVSEIPANEHRKTEAVSFDQMYAGLVNALAEVGIPEGLLSRSDLNTARSGLVMSRSYTLTLSDPVMMQNLKDFKPSDGYRINSAVYTYTALDPKIEQQLITQAIEDAKRKAANICSELDMQLGKILNIEDASTDCCGEIKDSKESGTSKTYNVNVTFELKD